MQQFLRQILVIVLIVTTTSMSAAAAACAAECAVDCGPETQITQTRDGHGCCNTPIPDEQRGDRGEEQNGCLSLHCRSAMIAVTEPVTTGEIAPVPADVASPHTIAAQTAHERIFHPPRA
jgi:hypothetical protein